MKQHLSMLIFISIFINYAYADELKKIDATYYNYLNDCAKNIRSHSFFPYSQDSPTTVYEGNNLSTECLINKFREHHLKNKIKDINNRYVNVGKVEITNKEKYLTITSLFDFVCGENCRMGENILINDKDKFYLIVSFNSDAGYEANLLKENIIHIQEHMFNKTNNTLFNTNTKYFNEIGSGDITFIKNGYLKKGVKSYLFKDEEPQGAFWFDAKYLFNNELIELIDYEGEYKECLTKDFFQSNKEIIQLMEQTNKDLFCVMR